MMKNDIAALHFQYYASAPDSQGGVIAFTVIGPGGETALEPLTEFGFTINHT